MNVQKVLVKNQLKGDLYILHKRNKLPKQQSLKYKLWDKKIKPTRIEQISKKPLHQQNNSNQKQMNFTNDLSTRTLERPTADGKAKVKRKNSEVSIVQDLQNSQNQNSKYHQFPNPEYKINVSNCAKKQLYCKKSVDQEEMQKSANIKHQQIKDIEQQIAFQYKNFASFFDYVLQFKLVKVESYFPKNNDVLSSQFQDSLPAKCKKLPNSLQVHLSANDETMNIEPTKPSTNQKPSNVKQLQNSLISLVDVRISNASIEDEILIQRNKKKYFSSSKIQMKKQTRVFYDSQNPHDIQKSIQENMGGHLLVQSQNLISGWNNSHSRIVSLEELKKKVAASKDFQSNSFRHEGYFCDDCKINPIIGKRYRCIECQNYDLCQKCYQQQCSRFKAFLSHQSNLKDPKILAQNSQFRNKNLFNDKPILKKHMSDIVQEEIFSPNVSTQNLKQPQQSVENINAEHVHVMQFVLKSSFTNLLNISKILRQTNRQSLDRISDRKSVHATERLSKRIIHNIPDWEKGRLNKIPVGMSRPIYSQRKIHIDHAKADIGLNSKNTLQNTINTLQRLKKMSKSLKASLG